MRFLLVPLALVVGYLLGRRVAIVEMAQALIKLGPTHKLTAQGRIVPIAPQNGNE